MAGQRGGGAGRSAWAWAWAWAGPAGSMLRMLNLALPGQACPLKIRPTLVLRSDCRGARSAAECTRQHAVCRTDERHATSTCSNLVSYRNI